MDEERLIQAEKLRLIDKTIDKSIGTLQEQKLGGKGASEKTADLILNAIKK